MKIRKIGILFDSGEKLVVPEEGEFKDGLNMIWSDNNNTGKTTILRGVISLLFSSSITFPKSRIEIGEPKKIKAIIETEGVRYTIYKNKSNKEIFLINNKKDIKSFQSQKELFEFLFNLVLPTNFSPSWIIDRFLMDQDFGARSPKLFASHFNSNSELLNASDLWLTSGEYKNKEHLTKISSEIKSLEIEKKSIEKVIEKIKERTNSDITGDAEYDKDFLLKTSDEIKRANSEIKTLHNQIADYKSQLNKIRFLSTKNNGGANQFETMYFVGENTMTGENVEVKASLKQLMNWTKKPLNLARQEYRTTENEINSTIKRLESKLFKIKTDRQKKFALLTSQNPEIIGINIDDMTNRHKEIKMDISNKSQKLKEFKKNFLLYDANIKALRKKVSKESTKIFNTFSTNDSKSGSDLFIRKFSDFFAFAREINHIKAPFFIDSAKDSDLDQNKFENLIDKMYGLVEANKGQALITITGDAWKGTKINPKHAFKIKEFTNTKK